MVSNQVSIQLLELSSDLLACFVMKWFAVLISFFVLSCVNNEVSEGGYKKEAFPDSPWRVSPSAWVNGAEVYSEVESLYGVGALEKGVLVYQASAAELDGPLRWRFSAEGDASKHVSMTIESVQITTRLTRRKVSIPAEMLEKVEFAYEKLKKPLLSLGKKRDGQPQPRWMASVAIPDVLQLFPKADGRVTVAAKIRIDSETGSVTEWVNFALLPNPDKTKSFVFRQTMVEYGGVPID